MQGHEGGPHHIQVKNDLLRVGKWQWGWSGENIRDIFRRKKWPQLTLDSLDKWVEVWKNQGGLSRSSLNRVDYGSNNWRGEDILQEADDRGMVEKCFLVNVLSLYHKGIHNLVAAYIFRLISFPSCLITYVTPTPNSLYHQAVPYLHTLVHALPSAWNVLPSSPSQLLLLFKT